MAATTYYVKAGFKTAYLQREIVLDIAPAATGKFYVGQVVKVDTNGELAAVSSTTSADAAKALAVSGTYIIAQSDMTMGYGHVPVENRDYRYSDEVATVDSTSRKFMVFLVTDPSDLVLSTWSETTGA